jgi:hypothetical protein
LRTLHLPYENQENKILIAANALHAANNRNESIAFLFYLTLTLKPKNECLQTKKLNRLNGVFWYTSY